MSLLKQVNKGPSINSFKQFYIQLHFYNNNLVPEQYTSNATHFTKIVSRLHVTFIQV
jgi:hypothetical protein